MSDENGNDTEMGKKLVEAEGKVKKQAAERKAKEVKGSHLLPAMQSRAQSAGLKQEERSGFFKFTGEAKGRAVYVAKNGGRVDISGIELDHPAVTRLTAEQAKEQHLGKVRGHIDFEKDDATVLEAFDTLVEKLKEAPAPKAEAAPEAKAEL